MSKDTQNIKTEGENSPAIDEASAKFGKASTHSVKSGEASQSVPLNQFMFNRETVI